ncbi:MAG TPA: sterol carrier protein domain-containing protein, partial [Actinomycetota bacterium]|nr:sterol carrier protein domain-containing protein [Actinomycetota bacterium]
DDVCPWVDGTWTVEVDGGEGKAVRVGDDVPARTNVAGLAALFAGYHDPRDLATLGIVRGLDPADVEFLQAMHAGPKPWSADYY